MLRCLSVSPHNTFHVKHTRCRRSVSASPPQRPSPQTGRGEPSPPRGEAAPRLGRPANPSGAAPAGLPAVFGRRGGGGDIRRSVFAKPPRHPRVPRRDPAERPLPPRAPPGPRAPPAGATQPDATSLPAVAAPPRSAPAAQRSRGSNRKHPEPERQQEAPGGGRGGPRSSRGRRRCGGQRVLHRAGLRFPGRRVRGGREGAGLSRSFPPPPCAARRGAALSAGGGLGGVTDRGKANPKCGCCAEPGGSG